MQSHRDVRQPFWAESAGRWPKPGLYPRIGEHVPAFGHTDIGGHRDEGHAGDQAAGDRQHRRRGRRGKDRNPVRAGDPFCHRRCGTDQVAAAQHGAVNAHRISDIGGGNRRGIQ